MKSEFKLDRTAFHAGSHQETEKYYAKNQPKTPNERLVAANYLNSVAFQFDIDNPPKMDRTAFSMRKHTL
ncbi:hypothetical protein [Dyadobacter fanqingshengii]|uniref:Uncharacterized protein n=1 Tax=Dyadobacter fanqingshengii TaxID=2906443 RepID=A0A9X1TBX1_9BACT|nr:hypothetical protein [Dyadobacter fanqingshengii]MCF0042469.1 hypothetical protein [Dyadobacter fanqingshengii]USJ35008.1 hypothetical protein NFI81_20185 [Dyadobacter fanqingshengii]